MVVVGAAAIEKNRTRACAAFPVGVQSVRDRGDVAIWRSDDAFGFTSHMFVNADGAPNTYTPADTGLSYLCDGAVAYDNGACIWPGQPDWQAKCRRAFAEALATNWTGEHMCVFGFEMRGGETYGNSIVGGEPLIQSDGDPVPGAFVSMTSMRIAGAPADSQTRYVDSTEIPFVVLSPTLGDLTSAKVSTSAPVATVWRPATGKVSFAVVADTGPTWQLGEGSVALHRALDAEPVELRGDTERAKRNILDDVVYLVFPGVEIEGATNHDLFRERIQRVGSNAFSDWGGLDRLKDCVEVR